VCIDIMYYLCLQIASAKIIHYLQNASKTRIYL
jgi:hypothetical protein